MFISRFALRIILLKIQLSVLNRVTEEAPRSYSFSGVADPEDPQEQHQNADNHQQDNYGYNYQYNYYDGNPEKLEEQYNQQAGRGEHYDHTQDQHEDQSGRLEDTTKNLEIHSE